MLVIFFIIIGIIARLLPHPPNVAPIAAIALFGGVYLDKRWAVVVPLAAMFLSDLILGFHAVMPYVYGSFVATTLLGMGIKKTRERKETGVIKETMGILGASLVSSILFYLVTNYGVWAETFIYPKTWAGLLQSYIMALPFFGNSLVGDLFYTVVFFGSYEVIKLKVKSEKLKVAV